jgi:aminomethyltransferase
MKRTPLYDIHVKLGAKMVPFSGWDMPVYYSSIIAEHKAVRTSAGIFDIGHMGAVKISGSSALPYLNRLLSNDVSKLEIGSAQYSIILNASGGVIDDIFVYKLKDHYMLILNASNTDKDIDWFMKNNSEGAEITDLKDNLTLLALQGPKAQGMLQKICDIDLKSLGHHKIIPSRISLPAGRQGDLPSLISRTGYTGEDGFELFFDRYKAEMIWNKLIELGAVPCGLGARDTLRLEAGMPLYGHEYNEGITPLETPFTFAVKLDKSDFIGKNSLVMHKEHGISKKLVGIKLKETGIPRQGFKIFKGSELVGYITSGTFSPTLNIPIGMGYVRVEHAQVGTSLDVEIRGKLIRAEVVKLPFYKSASI